MTNTYTETQVNISDAVFNFIKPSQFEDEAISDDEYSILPEDSNYLKVTNIKWVSTGSASAIPLDTTLTNSNQIISVMLVDSENPVFCRTIAPEFYNLNSARNGIILECLDSSLSHVIPAGLTFYVQVLTGIVFNGINVTST